MHSMDFHMHFGAEFVCIMCRNLHESAPKLYPIYGTDFLLVNLCAGKKVMSLICTDSTWDGNDIDQPYQMKLICVQN